MADAASGAETNPHEESDHLLEELGPQHDGDGLFIARMRAHQSWWRATRLGVPCGTGPTATSTTRYGNFLTAEDGRRGMNFLRPGILDVVRSRMAAGPGVEEFRCLHNLLSSQPLCFNLFAPLVNDSEAATRFLSALLPDEIGQVRGVWIEHSPSPKWEYLNDATAFDAFVIYDRLDGMPAFLAIETKLSEPFSAHVYDTPRYREIARASAAFRDADDPNLADISWNQLWRDHLLAQALLQHPSAPEALTGRLVVVHHPADNRCLAALTDYRALLASGVTVTNWSLDWLTDQWRDVAVEPDEEGWVAALSDRYVDLPLSEGAWSRLSASTPTSSPITSTLPTETNP